MGLLLVGIFVIVAGIALLVGLTFWPYTAALVAILGIGHVVTSLSIDEWEEHLSDIDQTAAKQLLDDVLTCIDSPLSLAIQKHRVRTLRYEGVPREPEYEAISSNDGRRLAIGGGSQRTPISYHGSAVVGYTIFAIPVVEMSIRDRGSCRVNQIL